MIKENLNLALNKQINEELASGYVYLSMSSYFEANDYPGMAKWMYAQYEEEVIHAMKFFSYINERSGRVILDTIARPESNWGSPLEVFEEALKHEEHITDCINSLVDLSIEMKDHATTNFLQWYVAEQVEEEATVNTIIGNFKLIKNSNNGMFMLDKELGQRAVAAPAV